MKDNNSEQVELTGGPGDVRFEEGKGDPDLCGWLEVVLIFDLVLPMDWTDGPASGMMV